MKLMLMRYQMKLALLDNLSGFCLCVRVRWGIGRVPDLPSALPV